MKQINNGFADFYYLDEEGNVFDIRKNRYLKRNKFNYKLRDTEGKIKNATLKTLYKLVYNKNFCKDEVESAEGEIWKDIEGTEGKYQASSLGRIKSKVGYESSIMIPTLSEKGYYKITIVIEGKPKKMFVHKIIFETFNQKKKEGFEIHHKNRHKNRKFDIKSCRIK